MIGISIIVVCIFRLVKGWSDPCASSTDLSSCIRVCTTNGSIENNEAGQCDSICSTCFGPLPSVDCGDAMCPDGSTPCTSFTNGGCVYPSTQKCFCGPCPDVKTCGIDP